MIILLNGMPGVGKLTIARALRDRHCFDSRIIDNHLAIDAAASVFPYRGKEQRALRDMIRRTLFAGVEQESSKDVVFVFTECLSKDLEDDRKVLLEIMQTAVARQVHLAILNLVCQDAEHKKRLTSPDRQKHARGKLQSVDVLEQLLQYKLIDKETVNDLKQLQQLRLSVTVDELDVTGIPAERVAELISAFTHQETKYEDLPASTAAQL